MPKVGYRHSPEALAKMRATRALQVITPGHRAAMSAGNKGKKRTPETRARMAEAARKRGVSDEIIAKMRAANLGRKLSPEHRARLSDARKGRVFTEETRAKIGAANRGRVHTEETRRRVAEAFHHRPVLGECAYCFGPATTHDHVIPRGRPGWGDPDNLVLACGSCNSGKNNRTPEEWFASSKTA